MLFHFHHHKARHRGLALAAVVACLACGRALSDDAASSPRAEAEIRERAEKYVQAIERGDAEEIASFWTADGDYTDDAGRAINGRRLARQAHAPPQHDASPRRLIHHVVSLRFVTPDVAIEARRRV